MNDGTIFANWARMKKIITVAFVLISLIAKSSDAQKVLRTMNNEAFKPGEKLKFRVHYGIVDAGEATLEVDKDLSKIGSRDCYHVIGTGKSVGAFNWFFEVRDRYESVIDKQALVPWMFIRRVDEGGFIINENVSFNHFQNTAQSNGTRNNKDISRGIDSLPDNIQDIISAFYYARTLDFSNAKEGDVFPISGLIDNEVFPMNLKYAGKEDVQYKKGIFHCLKFHPLLQEGRIFKEKEDMTVWISDDKNRIPIRVQTEILVGSIQMDLTDYENLANEPAFSKK
jgi:hypothetical protein